jgi:hypothetical protein
MAGAIALGQAAALVEYKATAAPEPAAAAGVAALKWAMGTALGSALGLVAGSALVGTRSRWVAALFQLAQAQAPQAEWQQAQGVRQ